MTAIQLATIAFGAIMLFATYLAFRRDELRVGEALVWAVVWAALIVVSLIPQALRAVVAPLEVARLLDLVMIAAILFLAVTLFLLNRSLRRLETRLVLLVRRLALDEDAKQTPPAG